MSVSSGSVPMSNIFQAITSATARRKRENEEVARRLSAMDPKQFLSNLQAAALTRSSKAVKALASDMYELEDIFQKLSKAGYDVSAARQDFQLLGQFVAQCMDAAGIQPTYESPSKLHKTRPRSQSVSSSNNSSSSIMTPQRPSTSLHSSLKSSFSSSSRSPPKHVHFASHATVYTLPREPVPPVLTPPSRPSCLPRVSHHDSTYHY
jgi:hypothetical protein